MKEDLFSQLRDLPHEENLPEGHSRRFSRRLDNGFHLEKQLWSLQQYLSVASVIIFIGISLLVLISIMDFRSSDAVFATNQGELYETELFLRGEINTKLDQLMHCENIDKSLVAEIRKTDKTFKQIQTDLEINPGDERLVSAVFESYQTKLDLLDRIISQVGCYNGLN